jgi:hypothetical protein
LANKNPLVFRYAYFSLKISPVISHKRWYLLVIKLKNLLVNDYIVTSSYFEDWTSLYFL